MPIAAYWPNVAKNLASNPWDEVNINNKILKVIPKTCYVKLDKLISIVIRIILEYRLDFLVALGEQHHVFLDVRLSPSSNRKLENLKLIIGRSHYLSHAQKLLFVYLDHLTGKFPVERMHFLVILLLDKPLHVLHDLLDGEVWDEG